MGVTTNLGQAGSVYQYVPSLKAKSGEIEALNQLNPALKPRVFPIFQMMSTVASTFATKVAAALPGLPVGLDGAARSASVGSALDFGNLLQSLGAAGAPVLPVLDVGTTGPYHTMVGANLNRYAPGLVLRTTLANLPNAATWLAQQGGPITTGDTDLLIDVGHIADFDPAQFATFVAATMQRLQMQQAGWRSLTLVSSSAPIDVGGLVPGPNLVPRRCWQLWQGVSPIIPGLHFGDHGVLHRSLNEVPPEAMGSATVSPRYTLPAEWIIRKGVQTRGAAGQDMGAQYLGHAQALIAHPNFGQVPGCWADARIQQIAALVGTTVGAGNRNKWVEYSCNRHLSVVCDQLP